MNYLDNSQSLSCTLPVQISAVGVRTWYRHAQLIWINSAAVVFVYDSLSRGLEPQRWWHSFACARAARMLTKESFRWCKSRDREAAVRTRAARIAAAHASRLFCVGHGLRHRRTGRVPSSTTCKAHSRGVGFTPVVDVANLLPPHLHRDVARGPGAAVLDQHGHGGDHDADRHAADRAHPVIT